MNQALEMADAPPLTPRQQLERLLYRQAQGHFAPAQAGSFFETVRNQLVAEYILKGLTEYDNAQAQQVAAPGMGGY